MNNYVFKIEAEPTAEMHVSVVAASAPAAVEIINRHLSEGEKRTFGTGLVGPARLPADFIFRLDNPVDETMIAGEERIGAGDLDEARRLLESEGYEYQDDEKMLDAAGESLFVKTPRGGEDGGSRTLGVMHVRARYDSNIRRFSFSAEAAVYLHRERSDLDAREPFCTVHFKSEKTALTVDDLPSALVICEEKLAELTWLLRHT